MPSSSSDSSGDIVVTDCVDSTGGVDTRLVLATLQKIGIKPQVGLQAVKEYSDFSNTGKFSEVNIVNQIVNHYDLNLNLFSENEYSKNRDQRINEFVAKILLNFPPQELDTNQI